MLTLQYYYQMTSSFTFYIKINIKELQECRQGIHGLHGLVYMNSYERVTQEESDKQI